MDTLFSCILCFKAENLQTQMLKNTTPTTTHSSPYNPNYPPSPQTKWGSGISRSTSNSPAYPVICSSLYLTDVVFIVKYLYI